MAGSGFQVGYPCTENRSRMPIWLRTVKQQHRQFICLDL